MSELILHHYWISPYAEKIRLVMGLKGLSWRSVEIPVVAPKPDLTALTGGYRKTPVLQIGADVYCDTDLIARTVDQLHRNPPLFPDDTMAIATMLGAWQQELFWLCVRAVGVAAPVFPPGFVEDRATMMQVPLSMKQVMADVEPQREQLRAKLDLLDRHLSRRRFLLGSQPGLADLSMYHPAWTLKQVPATAPLLDAFPHVKAWMEHVEAFGHGTFAAMTAEEAIAAARAATPASGQGTDPDEPNGLRVGDLVEVVHESFGNDPVVGLLVASSVHEIAVGRRDERAGEVVVHLPREHYKVRRL